MGSCLVENLRHVLSLLLSLHGHMDFSPCSGGNCTVTHYQIYQHSGRFATQLLALDHKYFSYAGSAVTHVAYNVSGTINVEPMIQKYTAPSTVRGLARKLINLTWLLSSQKCHSLFPFCLWPSGSLLYSKNLACTFVLLVQGGQMKHGEY